MFKGTYRHRIDGKGRVPVPAAFRRGLDSGSVVLTLLDQCLAAYSPAEWRRLEQQLAALPPFGRQARALTRLLMSRACDCALDTQGRILVPPALRAAAGLERETVLIGALDRFELWRPEAWEQFLKESERLLDDLTLDLPWALPPTAPKVADPAPALPPRPQAKPKR